MYLLYEDVQACLRDFASSCRPTSPHQVVWVPTAFEVTKRVDTVEQKVALQQTAYLALGEVVCADRPLGRQNNPMTRLEQTMLGRSAWKFLAMSLAVLSWIP